MVYEVIYYEHGRALDPHPVENLLETIVRVCAEQRVYAVLFTRSSGDCVGVCDNTGVAKSFVP